MLKFFRVPFALSGNKTPIPDAADPNGYVSYIEGYGPDYQRPKTDALSKNVERDKQNQLFFDTTAAIGELQSQGIPDFITSALNGGSPFPYPIYAQVRYSGNTYISLVAANTATPGTDPTKWEKFNTPGDAAVNLGSSVRNYLQGSIGWAIGQTAVNLSWFSQLVVANNWSPAWQAAHDFCETLPNGGKLIFPPGFSGQFKTALIWNPNKVGIDGNGALLDFGAFSGATYAVTLRQTITDANSRSAANRAHPWAGCVILGTGSATGTVTFIKVADNNPISGTPWAAGVTLRDCALGNWYRDVEIGNGGFFFNAENCAFYVTTGTGYDTSILVTNGTNSGENIRFDGGYFGKSIGTAIRCLNPNASVFGYGCSADYMSNLFDIQGGSLNWDGYIENNTDSDYWIKVGGTNTTVRIAGEMHITGSKSTKEIFYVDSTSTNGGLDFDLDFQWTGGVTYPMRLVAGTGRVRGRFRGHSRTTVHPAVGGSMTLLANGGFETAALTDWTLGGTTPPSIVSTPVRSGVGALRFPASPTNTPSATASRACQPGQYAVGEVWWQTAGLAGSGGTFYVTLDYLDAGGSVLFSSALLSSTASTGAWTFQPLYTFQPAPAGTVAARLTFSIFGTTSGSPNAYIDDVTFCIV